MGVHYSLFGKWMFIIGPIFSTKFLETFSAHAVRFVHDSQDSSRGALGVHDYPRLVGVHDSSTIRTIRHTIRQWVSHCLQENRCQYYRGCPKERRQGLAEREGCSLPGRKDPNATQTGKDAQGRDVNNTIVYEKQ